MTRRQANSKRMPFVLDDKKRLGLEDFKIVWRQTALLPPVNNESIFNNNNKTKHKQQKFF